jgi:hypothetical protein
MSTSSIHFQRADYRFAEKHNSRQTERQPSYLLPEDKRQRNEFVKLADVQTLHEKQIEYRRLTHARGRAPTLTDSYWEAVVNLNSEHTIDDVRRVAEHIRQKYKFTPTSIAIHRDEGYVDKVTGETKYNYHAHLTFYTIAQGRSQMRLMTRAKLRDLQTEVANLLGMQRGQEHSKAKRLDHQQYREVKRAEEELETQSKQWKFRYELAPVKTQKELNELKSKIRKEMIEQGGFSAQDYRALNQLITDYKNAFKLGETVTVSEVVEDIYQRLNASVKLKAENDRLTSENEKLTNKLTELQSKINALKQAQSQRELQRQSATVTVHNFEHKDSTVKLKDRYKVHSIIGDIDSRTETIIKNIRESDALGTQQQPLGREYYRTHMDSSDYNDIISKIDREHSKTRTERQNTQSMSNPTQIKKKSTYERF